MLEVFKLLCSIPSKLPFVVWTNFQKHIACLSETQSDNFFTWMAESKNFNWIRNDGSTNLKTRQVKTNLHFSVEHKVYIHETFPAKTTSFWLDALMFLYQCLQRIIMLLFLLNTSSLNRHTFSRVHVNRNTVRQKHIPPTKTMEKSRQESAFFKHLFVFNVFTSFNLLRKSEVLQAFQRPWPLGFILLYLFF